MNRAMIGIRAATVGFLVSVAFARGSPAEPLVSTDFLVSHVRVFDGESVHENVQVAIQGGIIRAVGRDLDAWRFLPVVEGTGATLIPGLVDAHVRVRDIEDLREALRFGVTTVLDMGTIYITPEDMAKLRAVAASRFDVADVRSAGFGAPAPGGHGTEYKSGVDVPSVLTAEIADEYVRSRKDEGSDYLKIFLNGVRTADRGMPNLDETRVKALVAAAHSAGMLAVAHVETLEDVKIALDSGIDGLAHVWRRGGPDLDVARRIAQQQVFVIATLDIADGFAGGRAALLADLRLKPYLSNLGNEQLNQPFSARTIADPGHDVGVARSLHEAKVMLLAGTDASRANPAVQGVSLHRELELLNQAGLSPMEVLIAATMQTAATFGLTDRGRVAPGLKADMVLVRGDPTMDISATRDILRVWRSGVEFDRTVVRE